MIPVAERLLLSSARLSMVGFRCRYWDGKSPTPGATLQLPERAYPFSPEPEHSPALSDPPRSEHTAPLSLAPDSRPAPVTRCVRASFRYAVDVRGELMVVATADRKIIVVRAAAPNTALHRPWPPASRQQRRAAPEHGCCCHVRRMVCICCFRAFRST